MTATPPISSGQSTSEIAASLLPPFHGTPAHDGPGGWWIFAEPELHLADDVLVPDFAAWRCGRMPTVPNAGALTLAPDWICEILSRSSVRYDRVGKMRCWAREGVAHVWLVDPAARTLETFRLTDDGWTVGASHAGDERARVDPFGEVEIDLGRWWLEP